MSNKSMNACGLKADVLADGQDRHGEHAGRKQAVEPVNHRYFWKRYSKISSIWLSLFIVYMAH